ncbi:unnamed protein product [Lactuca saligna]|uniref:F-box associated beta-propeller type 3 domain-containing protein n=1 Tax=Lactuca saligna TaxID=75948 RepID=A0AA35YHY6_LACSI|nr:unnamed protein product [Lactuca saligna]
MDSTFCYDMKMEILWKTSLKTLDIIRCTSKELEKLTYESYFLRLYNQKNNDDMVSGFIQVILQNAGQCMINLFAPSTSSNHESANSRRRRLIDLDFLPPKAQILASSEQGIMVFQSPHPRDYKLVWYHVCKPATKQVLRLPNPKTRYFTQNVAMVVVASKPVLHYKIIRLSEPKRKKRRIKQYCPYTKYCYEIFDSKAWAWRLLDPVLLPCSAFLLTNQQPITARGSIYMLLNNNQVLKFEACSEKWTTFSPPIQTLDYPCSDATRKLVKYKGKLGFICETQSRRKIWVLRSVDDSWEEKLDVFDTERSSLDLEAIYESETRVKNNDYNTLHSNQVFTFRSDFEPANF